MLSRPGERLRLSRQAWEAHKKTSWVLRIAAVERLRLSRQRNLGDLEKVAPWAPELQGGKKLQNGPKMTLARPLWQAEGEAFRPTLVPG